jgi:hypothetical protein
MADPVVFLRGRAAFYRSELAVSRQLDEPELADAIDAVLTERASQAEQIRRLTGALGNMIDASITDSDSCPFCGEHVRRCGSGCPVVTARAALEPR